ncbi:hypothetical protein L210DRAFT_109503 [Boletus edulis BED1]|uniref:Uncharacterized protein n=1 Tax=Boletus edulis BED1 TaxID=1328754 RepID=A0AAD4GBV2_BOLED|nr:hypothetical protein L210DRAFT_109503 [Boletus edulis BED1]
MQTHFFKNTPHTIGIRLRTRPPLANNAYLTTTRQHSPIIVTETTMDIRTMACCDASVCTDTILL